ncbi:hypothetical protein B0T09DRAFT_319993 [Sordaria sp. MPI-SDFR-AT-0083]|nr:hypothetical protein B0T09DRAFT_319993 [Sordaria sp. MPI-SDFR-AT-0083]
MNVGGGHVGAVRRVCTRWLTGYAQMRQVGPSAVAYAVVLLCVCFLAWIDKSSSRFHGGKRCDACIFLGPFLGSNGELHHDLLCELIKSFIGFTLVLFGDGQMGSSSPSPWNFVHIVVAYVPRVIHTHVTYRYLSSLKHLGCSRLEEELDDNLESGDIPG